MEREIEQERGMVENEKGGESAENENTPAGVEGGRGRRGK